MLMERILTRENLLNALKRVERNGGSHGVDNMTTKDLRSYIVVHWDELKKSLSNGTYKPQPVRRVEIPKPNGGKRLLGIPTVLDRFIQQAITQVLTPIYEPSFSEHSYGFRPKRRGHDAVREAKGYIKEGYRWVVDIDLEKLGWCGYYALADTASHFKDFDKWLRRRLRMCLWKQWKTPKTRIRKLTGLGVNFHKAYEWGNSRKGFWRIAKSPILHRTLGNAFWQNQGLKSLYQRYEILRQT
ncbi:reverse transcriptase domain-containing protein [Bacillus sp. AFS088145]|uniref:reverse transcriptase domain-containing protein n=1 Tax=Bacillus sp. AFS088145 TaxID=2033514 RepID=UPI000BF56D20|nr:reverse transcriptase domain-containing protein [Bacillus sp. AFS088145]PFH84813.1 hypothetical protein COI44_16045 [Bacillus sp. AFS088145]